MKSTFRPGRARPHSRPATPALLPSSDLSNQPNQSNRIIDMSQSAAPGSGPLLLVANVTCTIYVKKLT